MTYLHTRFEHFVRYGSTKTHQTYATQSDTWPPYWGYFFAWRTQGVGARIGYE